MTKKFIEAFLNFIFPAFCQSCHKRLEQDRKSCLCKSCWEKIQFVKPPYCILCGKPLVSNTFIEYPHYSCRDCRASPPHFTQARAVGIYEGVLREAIHLFKYKHKRSLAKPLGKLMVDYVRNNGGFEMVDAILPVPLHSAKRREREYNQAALLARQLGSYLNLPVLENSLTRKRATKSQTELNREERLKNVKGVFAVRMPGQVAEKSLLLVDDVITTGATINECAKVLRKAKAKCVYVFALARDI